MESFSVFKDKSIVLALETYKSNPALDGTLLLFAESENIENNALWGVTFSNKEEKDALLAFMALSMDKRKSQRYAIMSMAWMSNDPTVRPSKSATRTEVLLVGISERYGSKESYVYDVIRAPDNKIVEFKMQDMRDFESHSGLMFNLLNRQNSLPIPDEISAYADLKLASMLISGEPIANRTAQHSSPYKKPN